MTTTVRVDRAAAIRRAVRDLVAENGFHGASMTEVGRRAGVATGTAYVHYESKEELVYATYLELKREMSAAVLSSLDVSAAPEERFAHIWRAIYLHLSDEPARARFLSQLEESPYFAEAHARVLADGDALLDEASRPDLAELLIDLPPELLYALGIGPAVRLVASGAELDGGELDLVIRACWRAITT